MAPDAKLGNAARQRVDLAQPHLGEARNGHGKKKREDGDRSPCAAHSENATSQKMPRMPQINASRSWHLVIFHSWHSPKCHQSKNATNATSDCLPFVAFLIFYSWHFAFVA